MTIFRWAKITKLHLSFDLILSTWNHTRESVWMGVLNMVYGFRNSKHRMSIRRQFLSEFVYSEQLRVFTWKVKFFYESRKTGNFSKSQNLSLMPNPEFEKYLLWQQLKTCLQFGFPPSKLHFPWLIAHIITLFNVRAAGRGFPRFELKDLF